jgi:NADPH2:quinone reductase
MTYAIRFHQPGGAETLRWEQIDTAAPGRGEVSLRQTAVGLNFLDVYERSGLYPVASLPSGLGREGAGVIESVGPGVKNVKPGDRFAYVSSQPGAYAQERVLPVARLVPIPDGVSDRLAAASMLKGLTAHFLLRRTHRVRKGDAIVILAAAGGVGSIVVQWARHLGATVIAIVGSEAKADLVSRLGAHHVLLQGEPEWPARVRELTGGKGADVVYDSVGEETFEASLDCLRPRGLMVSFGNASGPVPPVSVLELSRRGSLYLTRPTLFHYIATRAELERGAHELFDVIGRGLVRIEIGQTYPLQDAAQAHRDLEGRRTVGSTVLLP